MSAPRIKYVAWRGGRPRFSPGLTLRSEGHKGQDLQHADGRWFTFEEATAWSNDFAVRALGKNQPALSETAATELYSSARGFVYFLGAGDRVKIGFSLKPGLRSAQLMTAVSEPMTFFIAIPGTMRDERQLHKQLSRHRTRGEWFRLSLSVVRIMQRAMVGKIEHIVLED